MTDDELTAIEERVSKLPPNIDPYTTAKGGVVILNGPFPMDKALAVEHFIDHAPADVLALVAEIRRLRAVVSVADGLAALLGGVNEAWPGTVGGPQADGGREG